jgi:hypothetical protein
MKIGNILTNSLYVPDYLNNVSFVEEGVPTIIVGWKAAKELYPDMSLRDWKISDNIYWTMDSQDDKMKMESDLLRFKSICLDSIIKKYQFTYIDLLLNPAPALNFSHSDKILLTNSIIYIKNLESIVSISLELSSSVGYDIFKLIPNNILMLDETAENKFGVENKFLLCFL